MRALISFAVGMEPAPCVLASLMDAAARWWASLRILREPIESGLDHPHAQRLALPRWALDQGYTEYVAVDLDLMIRSDMPCPLDLMGDGLCGFVPLDGMLHLRPDYLGISGRYLARWAQILVESKPTPVAINGGVQAVRVTPETVGGLLAVLDAARRLGPKRFARYGTDQVAINWGISKGLLPGVVDLPRGMNFIVAPRPDWVDPDEHDEIVRPGPMRYYVQHLAGCRRTYDEKSRIMAGWEWRA